MLGVEIAARQKLASQQLATHHILDFVAGNKGKKQSPLHKLHYPRTLQKGIFLLT